MIKWKTFRVERARNLFAAAVDKRLVYPKTHDESEITRGLGAHPSKPVVTETHCACIDLADGTFAVQVDEVVRRFDGEVVELDVGAGRETVTIDCSGAKEVDRDTAIHRPARGGLTIISET